MFAVCEPSFADGESLFPVGERWFPVKDLYMLSFLRIFAKQCGSLCYAVLITSDIMPYYYKREIPDLNGTGEKQYRYELRSEGTTDLRRLARLAIRRFHSMTEGEVMGLVTVLTEEMAHEMANGRTVSIDGLGSFSLSLGVEHRRSHYDEEDAAGRETNARSVRVRGVNFRVSSELVNEVDRHCRGHLHREGGGPVSLRHSTLSRNERMGMALRHIREHGFLRLADYARLVNVSRTVASLQLRDFHDDPSVPICAQGHGPSKVWVEVRSEK